MKTNTIIVLSVAVGIIIGGFVGYWTAYQIATYESLNWCVEQAFTLLEKQGFKVEIDPSIIAVGLQRYKIPAQNFISCLNKTEAGWLCSQPNH